MAALRCSPGLNVSLQELEEFSLKRSLTRGEHTQDALVDVREREGTPGLDSPFLTLSCVRSSNEKKEKNSEKEVKDIKRDSTKEKESRRESKKESRKEDETALEPEKEKSVLHRGASSPSEKQEQAREEVPAPRERLTGGAEFSMKAQCASAGFYARAGRRLRASGRVFVFRIHTGDL
ncbi:Uncharacterized protein DAT39_011401, partial [Clarias magur]